jgi:hypothetical protein
MEKVLEILFFNPAPPLMVISYFIGFILGRRSRLAGYQPERRNKNMAVNPPPKSL